MRRQRKKGGKAKDASLLQNAFASVCMTSNCYILLNLSIDPPEMDEEVIRQAIDNKEKEWSYTSLNGIEGTPKKTEADMGLALLDTMRRVMFSPERRLEEAQAAAFLLQEEQEAFSADVILLDISGSITEQDKKNLIARYPLLHLTKKNIDERVMLALRNEPSHSKETPRLPDDTAARLRKAFSSLQEDYCSLYAFLDTPDDAEQEELEEAIERMRKRRLQDSSSSSQAVLWSELLDLARLIFPAQRAAYDAWLAGEGHALLSDKLHTLASKKKKIDEKGYTFLKGSLSRMGYAFSDAQYLQIVRAFCDYNQYELEVTVSPENSTESQIDELIREVRRQNERAEEQKRQALLEEERLRKEQEEAIRKETVRRNKEQKHIQHQERLRVVGEAANLAYQQYTTIQTHYKEMAEDKNTSLPGLQTMIVPGVLLLTDLALVFMQLLGVRFSFSHVSLRILYGLLKNHLNTLLFGASAIAGVTLLLNWLTFRPFWRMGQTAEMRSQQIQKEVDEISSRVSSDEEALEAAAYFQEMAEDSTRLMNRYNREIDLLNGKRRRAGREDYPHNLILTGLLIDVVVHAFVLFMLLVR